MTDAESTTKAPPPATFKTAVRIFDFPDPVLEVVTPEAIIVSWRPPRSLSVGADAAAPSPRSPAATLSQSSALFDSARVLRRYYVEWRWGSAGSYTMSETAYCHIVLPVDFIDEPLNVRVSFRSVNVANLAMHVIQEQLAKADVYAGERVSFHVRRPRCPHALLSPASPLIDCPVAFALHPFVMLAFNAAVSTHTNPTGSVGNALCQLYGGPAESSQLQLLGYDKVATTKLSAVQVTLAKAFDAPEAIRGSWIAACTRCVILIASDAADRSNHRSASPEQALLSIESRLLEDWLADDTTVVIVAGFGAHGFTAARAAATLNSHILNPAPHVTLPSRLESDVSRRHLSKRLLCVTFCAPMERYLDHALNQPIVASAADSATRMLAILPRNDAVSWSASSTTASSTGGMSAFVTPAAVAADEGRGRVSQFNFVDAELGQPVEFAVDQTLGLVTCTTSHGTCSRTAEDDAASLDVSPRNTSLISQLRSYLLACVLGTTVGDAAHRTRPRIEAASIKAARSSLFTIDIKGTSLDGVRAVTLVKSAKKRWYHDVSLADAKMDSNRIVIPAHMSVFIPFVDNASSGTVVLSVFVASETGCDIVHEIAVQLPATVTPFLASNFGGAKEGGEVHEKPADLFNALLRIEALSLWRTPSTPLERSARVLCAIDLAATAVDHLRTSQNSTTSLKAVFSRAMQSAAARLSSDPLASKDLLAVPASAISADHVRSLLAKAVDERDRIADPDALLSLFGPHMKRWLSALPFIASLDAYAKKVVELGALCGIPWSQEVIDRVIGLTYGGPCDKTFGPAEVVLATLESVLYHHVCAQITSVGIKSAFPHALLADTVNLPSFVADQSRVILGSSAKYSDAKASDAFSIFEDVVALWVVCHVFFGRIVERYTRFIGVAGPRQSGVSAVLTMVNSIDARDAEQESRGLFSRTITTELPFKLAFLIVAMNVFRSISVVIVAERQDCEARGPVHAVLEALGLFKREEKSGLKHVGLFINKLDELVGRVGLEGRSLDEFAASLTLECVTQMRNTSTTIDAWPEIAVSAGAVAPRVPVPGISTESFIAQATSVLRCIVLASNV